MKECDVCIVGGGVMGCSAAYWLSKTHSLKILLLDQYGVGNEYCSSNDFNRVFRYAYGKDEYYTRMAVESLRLWRTLELQAATTLLIPTGLLMLEGTDNEANSFNHESHQTLTRLGLGAEKIHRRQLKNRFPQFNADSGVLDPHGGVLLASKTLEIFASQAQCQGVEVQEKKVTEITQKDQLTIETSTGDQVSCEKAIITTGAWTDSLGSDHLPRVTPTRQQVAYLRPKERLENFLPESFPVFFTDRHYGLPAAGIDGVKVSNKKLLQPIDPETADRTVDPREVDACRKACQHYIPPLANADLAQAKVCIYDMTTNSDFVVGTDPEKPELIYAYGFSGHGFKFAPLIGKLLAEITLGRTPSFNIDRLSPTTDHDSLPIRPY